MDNKELAIRRLQRCIGEVERGEIEPEIILITRGKYPRGLGFSTPTGMTYDRFSEILDEVKASRAQFKAANENMVA